jgi:hypothetical protein
MIDQMIASRMLDYIIGFEKSLKDGPGRRFNLILSNRNRSQRIEGEYYDHLIPEGCHKRIRSVSIFYSYCITGLSFFDKDKKLLWKLGKPTYPGDDVETVLINKNEIIIGVVAKQLQGYDSWFTDFQFQIGTREE